MDITVRKLAWDGLQKKKVMDGGTMIDRRAADVLSEVFVIFRKKSSLPSCLPCSSNSSRCSFVIFLTLVLAWFLISALSLRYFSTYCNTL